MRTFSLLLTYNYYEKILNDDYIDIYVIGSLDMDKVSNLIKKYNSFFNEKIDENVEIFKYIKLENQKPIPVKYKDILLLGDKVTIEFTENDFVHQFIICHKYFLPSKAN